MAQSDAIGATDAPNGILPRPRAVLFIVFLGIVSLFGDMTYEGARSITGPYLGVLGVTATTIGIVAGFGGAAGLRRPARLRLSRRPDGEVLGDYHRRVSAQPVRCTALGTCRCL